MSSLRVLYRDVDRTPYLYALRYTALKRGLDVELTQAPKGNRYGEFLIDGETDVLAENYWGLQSFRAAGRDFISLATAVCTLNEKLFVKSDVDHLEQLKGKRIAIRGVGPSQYIPKLWLKDHGFGVETEAVVISEKEVGRWGNWKKVIDGDCAGCFITNFYQDEPKAAGLKEFPIEPYGFIGNVTLTTTEALAHERHADMQRLVDAAHDASRLFKQNKEKALEIIAAEPMRLMNIDNDAELTRVYGILSDELSDRPVPSAAAISNTHRMRLQSNPELEHFNPMLMWDLSFARNAARN
jgi:ABC-type nitrate/sulfonate/bicarbonate transport system substrate-binding protein